MQEYLLLLKLDFKNAFNCLRREKTLAVVSKKAPELFSVIHLAYGTPSSLFIGDTIIQSAEGIQQGDLLGPLLFCLTTMEIMEQLRSEVIIIYLDDGTLGGSVEDITQDLQLVEREAGKLGLQLNHAKSEIISHDHRAVKSMLEAVPDLYPVRSELATLLGSPIGGEVGVEKSISERTEALRVMGDRLRHLHVHDAYCLLQHALALPKVLYTLRTSPWFQFPSLQSFDLLLRALLGDIANINIIENGLAWSQASISVWSGGLGVRSGTQLPPSVFLASVADCTDIIRLLLPPRLRDTPYLARGRLESLQSGT